MREPEYIFLERDSMEDNCLLNRIKGPADVKKLDETQLDGLCAEIRSVIVKTVAQNGGHLASNLGVVELTVALHRVFDSPHDQIVWDVSHQSYTHKLLTGRLGRFPTLRRFGGLSGFIRPEESEHDIYEAGHSSTSISAAYGLARAKALNHDPGYVVAVIGDGSLSGGLAFEGLNNAGRTHDRLIVILNDNGMSISKNVGAMARHLSVIRANPIYFRIKDGIESFVSAIPFVGGRLRNRLFNVKAAIKDAVYHSTVFEELGFAYLGPADGHNIGDICHLLQRAKEIRRPSIIHLHTIKGKGCEFAEKNPDAYHGVSGFDIRTGALPVKTGKTFSDTFGEALEVLAEKDVRICAVTAAMKDGTGLGGFASKFRQRFFDVGIAEQHAVVFSAGLARNGMIPVFAVYSSFLQRAYDQILVDAALQKLKVVFAVDRAGLVGPDGETHQGIFDAAYLNTVPGITVYSPASFRELRFFLKQAVEDDRGPAVVRYPRGGEPVLPDELNGLGSYDFTETIGSGVLIVAYGTLSAEAWKACEALRKQGAAPSILKINRIKPIDKACYAIAMGYGMVTFFEEGVKSGGIGEHFGTGLLERGFKGEFHVCAIDDQFVPQGTVKELLACLGLDARGMAETLLREWSVSNAKAKGSI